MSLPNIAVIGDIHGNRAALAKALAEAKKVADTIVTVGDYVNRGSDSKGVVDTLCDAKEELKERLVLLRGNHDVSLLQFLADGDRGRFLRHGGLRTVQSYIENPTAEPIEQFRKSFPAAHRDLLEYTELFLEEDAFLISHCGINPDDPASRSLSDMTLRSHWGLFDNAYKGSKLVVCGHYIQEEGKPYISTNFICIDTGCGSSPSAPLTSILLSDMSIRQY